MDFITIDFETANTKPSSPCELGLTFVRDGHVTETRSWLIRPMYNEYNYFNIRIHGIRPEETENEPEFDGIWAEVAPLIEGQFLIAHNASFDFTVLSKTLEAYHLPFPNLHYACSCIFSKKIWSGLQSYGLKYLCQYHSIPLRHHRAGDDSRATAHLAVKAFRDAGIDSLPSFEQILSTKLGQFTPAGVTKSKTVRNRKKPSGSPLQKIAGMPTPD